MPVVRSGYGNSPQNGLFVNVPVDQVDELIGRKSELREMRKRLVEGRAPIETISGRGGVGKTAVAIELVRQLWNEDPRVFKAIIWVTAKDSRLTATGIEHLEPELKNYEQLVRTIVVNLYGEDDIGRPFRELEDDANLLLSIQDFPVLLVVDNLETISDVRIVEFIKNIPAPSKVLVTSRSGIGEVERRFALGELNNSDAVRLTRTTALHSNEHAQAIVRLGNDELSRWIEPAKGVAAALKWMVAQVSLGKSLEEVTSRTGSGESDPVQFFFGDVYQLLNGSARLMLFALTEFNEPPSRESWRMVTELGEDEFDAGMNDLTLASMIYQTSVTNDDDSVSSRYHLAGLTGSFAKSELDKQPGVSMRLSQRYQDYLGMMAGTQEASDAYKYSMQYVGAQTEQQKIAAYLANAGQAIWQDKADLEAARGYFKRALELAPEFPFVYKRAVNVEDSAGNYSEADRIMQTAVETIPDDAGLWYHWAMTLSYSPRGNLPGLNNRILGYLNKAHQLDSADNRIAHRLAMEEIKLGRTSREPDQAREARFQRAEKLIDIAAVSDAPGLGLSEEVKRRQSHLCDTARAELYNNWGLLNSYQRRYRDAIEKLGKGSRYIERAQQTDPSDTFTIKQLKWNRLRWGRALGNMGSSSEGLEKLTEAEYQRPFRGHEKFHNAEVALQRAWILRRTGDRESAKQAALQGLALSIDERQRKRLNDLLVTVT